MSKETYNKNIQAKLQKLRKLSNTAKLPTSLDDVIENTQPVVDKLIPIEREQILHYFVNKDWHILEELKKTKRTPKTIHLLDSLWKRIDVLVAASQTSVASIIENIVYFHFGENSPNSLLDDIKTCCSKLMKERLKDL